MSEPATTYQEFRELTRFPALDGVRAIAVLMVITVHSGFHSDFWLWGLVDGSMGVPIFFVLSGYLITTLCLREEADRGSVSLKAFYIRRALRLLPAYYLTLILY